MVSTSGELAYFSSNMEGGYGSFDIYSFELYPEARPLPVTYMKGKVFDAKTDEALSAHFQLIELSTGKLIYSAYSEAASGEFLIPITYGQNYALNVEKEDYLFFSENFELKDDVGGDPFFMNVPLNKIEVGSEFILRNVFFETDEYELKPESKIELDKLISFLNAHPKVTIEIEGHTDDQGNEAHNRSLSEARAKSVYNYLIENNISKDRLKYKGYAADKPIADNSTEEGRSKNRRTSIQIIAK
jgi:outer membrane protein OmpA-like peptidoglycan-associated protein